MPIPVTWRQSREIYWRPESVRCSAHPPGRAIIDLRIITKPAPHIRVFSDQSQNLIPISPLIGRMVSENSYCIDILQQVSAARGALQKLALILLRDHLETCVSDALVEKNSTGKVQELMETLDRFLS